LNEVHLCAQFTRRKGNNSVVHEFNTPSYFIGEMFVMDSTRNFSFSKEGTVLVVDLDDTLVQTDMLFETFWSAISARWLNAIPAAQSLTKGKAAFKRKLEELGPVDPALLPYNQSVIEYIEVWRSQGGRTALVSAADQRIVDQVAKHLDLFDEACGSDGVRNLKGLRKADHLCKTYGQGGFAYIGDAEADLDVWREASHAVTVGVSPSLAARVETEASSVEHLNPAGSRTGPLIKAMRPHQWLKNILVFLPLLAAHQFTMASFSQALLAFLSFSLVASSVYVLNDLLDLESDRKHPRKRLRPFASGTLPLSWGAGLAPGLLALGFGVALFLGSTFVAVMALYYIVTTAYSFFLKRRLVVDICALAGLYTLRIIAGGVATDITLSVWLLAFSMFFFFALAAMKRQAELVAGEAAGESKAHGRSYRISDLPLIANMAVSSGYVSVLVMALYLNTDAITGLYANPTPLWGICFVLLFWLSRMVMISHRGMMHDDPVVFAAKDLTSMLCALIILACAVAGAIL
jgi:4-hydroxybenzoate polyprenyltransferase/phosphoglycolate phosphatase-like HAD superfamily hydrolase